MLLAVALMPVAALGEDRAAARRRFAEGERAYAAGDWETALVSYQAAFAAAPLPALQYNIAQCHRKLGHWVQARDAYQRFIDSDPEGEIRAVAEELLREVAARIPPDVPEPEPPAAPEPHRPEPTPPAASPSGIRWPTLAAAGAGLLLAGVAVAFAIDLGDAQSDLDDPSLDCGLELDRCLDLRDRGRSSATWRTVFAAGSAVALGAAAVLLALDLSRGPERESRLAIVPHGAAMELTW
ncbi:MAG: tetratricopeptide repeat protein [Deltaproteobacteria bacterium]|nr:tetratricopeptide repeat protein [Deltaproteobacteria bacterium]